MLPLSTPRARVNYRATLNIAVVGRVARLNLHLTDWKESSSRLTHRWIRKEPLHDLIRNEPISYEFCSRGYSWRWQQREELWKLEDNGTFNNVRGFSCAAPFAWRSLAKQAAVSIVLRELLTLSYIALTFYTHWAGLYLLVSAVSSAFKYFGAKLSS